MICSFHKNGIWTERLKCSNYNTGRDKNTINIDTVIKGPLLTTGDTSGLHRNVHYLVLCSFIDGTFCSRETHLQRHDAHVSHLWGQSFSALGVITEITLFSYLQLLLLYEGADEHLSCPSLRCAKCQPLGFLDKVNNPV